MDSTEKERFRAWGAQGGRVAAASMTPEQRTARARKAWRARCVNEVVERMGELRPEQVERIRMALTARDQRE